MRHGMKQLRLILLILATLGILGGCKKKSTSSLSFSLTPSTITALNVKTSNCTDAATYTAAIYMKPPPTTAVTMNMSANPGIIEFFSMTISWKNSESTLTVYGIEFTGKDASGNAIDIVLSGADFRSFVYGAAFNPIAGVCAYCTFNKTIDDKTSSITIKKDDTNSFVLPNGTRLASTVTALPADITLPDGSRALPPRQSDGSYVLPDGAKLTGIEKCPPIVGGIPVPKSQTSDVILNMKATLLAFSTDTAGNINNEYVSFPFSVRIQAPPL